MSPPPWTTTSQYEFLLNRREDYARAQDSKDDRLTLTDFRSNLHRDFFALWPNQDAEANDHALTFPDKHGKTPQAPPVIASDTEWVADRKKKLVNWFNNHPLGQRVRVGGKPKITISLNAESSRVKSEKSIYSSLHYEDKVKPTIDISILNGDKKMRLANINQEVAIAYANESEEVKAEIRSIREKLKLKKQKERDLLYLKRKAGHIERSAEEYDSALMSLPDMVSEFVAKMEVYTGWSFTVLAGGPDPSDHGDITSLAIHSSEDIYGNSFGKAHPNFNTAYLVPYSDYLRHVYTEDIRRSRALVPRDTTASAGPSGSNSHHNTGTSDENPSAKAKAGLSDHGASDHGADASLSNASPSDDDADATANETSADGGARSPENPKTIERSQTMTGIASTVNAQPVASVEPTELFQITPQSDESYPLTEEQLKAIAPINPTEADAQVLSEEELRKLALDILGLPYDQVLPPPVNGSAPTEFQPQASESGLPALPPPVNVSVPAMLTASTKPPNIVFGGDASNRPGDIEPGAQEEPEKNTDTGSAAPRRVRKVITKQAPVPLTETSEVVNKWFDDAHAYLSDEEIPLSNWKACVAAWVAFEKENGGVYTNSNRLPNSNERPSELGRWVTLRKYSQPPKIENLSKFANEWVLWWNSIQPQWRRTSEVNSLPLSLSIATEKQNMSALKKTGPSGIVVMLLSLKMWYPGQGGDARWERAVDDIHECLKVFALDDGKRKAVGRGDDGARKKQKTK